MNDQQEMKAEKTEMLDIFSLSTPCSALGSCHTFLNHYCIWDGSPHVSALCAPILGLTKTQFLLFALQPQGSKAELWGLNTWVGSLSFLSGLFMRKMGVGGWRGGGVPASC
jgi:hypothetical protein